MRKSALRLLGSSVGCLFRIVHAEKMVGPGAAAPGPKTGSKQAKLSFALVRQGGEESSGEESSMEESIGEEESS